MIQPELIQKLGENHDAFLTYVALLPEAEFLYSHGDKWTAGQQLEHILLSVKPLVQILSLPKAKLIERFGVSTRPSITFGELVSKYHHLLQNGAKASERFVPSAVSVDKRQELMELLSITVRDLESKVNQLTEQDLDEILIPHPLLGELTLREMLFFTAYHVEHHHKSTRNNLLAFSS